MKAMIIGAGGFVGSYLTQAIHDNLYCDIVATKMSQENLSLPGARVIDLNILEKDQIAKVLNEERPDYIFHLAAQSSVALSWKDPGMTVAINIKGALNLLDTIRELDYQPRVLIVGSGEEFGHIKDGTVPINEDAPLDPGNVYAVTKVTQNMMATIYAHAYGLKLIMTRSFNHVGPKQSPQFVVSDFCSQVVKIEKGLQEPIMNVGNLTAKRDFTDVRDVVRAYTLLMQYGKPGETYNVGLGHAIAIQDILGQILEQTDAKIEVRVDPSKLRPVDVPIIEPDTSKIFRDTGWRPEITLTQTIKDTLDYWRESL